MPSVLLLGLTLSALAVTPMPRDTIPEPETVSAREIPAPVVRPADTSGTAAAFYYLVFDGRSERFDEEDPPEVILQALLDRGIAMTDAWAPIAASIEEECMAPNVFLSFVVRLEAPDEIITELDFTQHPERVYPNCGVEQFYHYVFDE